MKAKIAVATVKGRAYYKLVKELKERNLPFLSIVPGEPIPSTIKVVLTTPEETSLIEHVNVLTFHDEMEPSAIVNEAIRIIHGKKVYNELTIGVDPGKTFGVAVLGDGEVLKAEDGLTLERAIDMILTSLKENPSKNQTIRIGGGVTTLAEEIFRRLSRALPDNVSLEIVDEEGTSRLREEGYKKISDADSAIKIAEKKGGIRYRRRGL